MSIYKNVFFLRHAVIKIFQVRPWKSVNNSLNEIAVNTIYRYLFIFILIDIEKRLKLFDYFVN